MPLQASVHAAKPTDPQVQAMIRKGIQFLHSEESMKGLGHREGSEMLIAYAVFKVDHEENDPIVKRGLDQAIRYAGQSASQIRNHTYANYEMAVAILLLAEVDPVKYENEIRKLRDVFVSGQRGHGGYGYYSEQAGDISQTQYVMLALWTLDKNGFQIPTNATIGVTTFFLRTQAPQGGWGYKGNVAPKVGQKIPQDNRVGETLTMGGAGSLLIAGELFGFWESPNLDPALAELPIAFKPAESEKEKMLKAAEAAGIKPALLLGSVSQADRFLANPKGGIRLRDYYKIYTMERYRSFVEIATGNIVEEPDWYNKGVADLRSKQSDNGAWGIKDAYGSGGAVNDEPAVATAFAILFLIRSTKKSIVSFSQATARGGQGLPKDASEIRMEGGQVKGSQVAGAVDGLLNLLEQDGADELDGQSIPEDLKLATEPEARRKQLDRLIRLVRGSQSWQARRVAARVLGQSGELRVVPALIYALSDNDTYVRRFARDGLRFVSRRFDGFGMPDKPNATEIKAAQQAWRDWYLSLDPGYVFLDADS
ncbi:HEAT repeat domain-containing protein [Roseimaritima multifibrata]|uniref:HEAT repeat domain-containing protein n=1 Tax=Roseimaritima multifibrata TaxID=1930274 RepID=UPI001C54D25D|nr:HEAT repeat domain-containing protein [Roseimaritima multifibrata]